MHSKTSSVSLKYSLRLTLLCLLATIALLRPLPERVYSSGQPPTQQNLAPEINTGALNTAREGHTATLLQNGKVLVAGGRNGGTLHNTAEVYDPVTAAWTLTANTLSNARYGHSAVLLRSGLVLVIGGQGGSGFLNTAEIYDPADNSWKSAQLSQMNAPRFHTSATLLNTGRVLVAGGQNSSGYLRSAELYNPTTRVWTRLDPGNNPAGNLTDARAEQTATLLSDGRVLVAGGFNGTAALRTAELFEPNTNRFRRVGDMTTPRRQQTATLLPDNTVLVAGGLNGATALNSSETYNPATSAWTASGNLANGRRAHTATLLPNGRVFAAGGRDGSGNSLNTAEAYNLANRTWSSAPLAPPFPSTQSFTLAEARGEHTATILPNGQVLLAGGLGGGAALSSAELYEYATGFWSVTKTTGGATTQMNVSRAGHTATLLPNGKVLVVGGLSQSGSSLITLGSAELYDPNTGMWTTTGSLNQARYNQTATLLPNGKVLVVGGIAGSALDSAELYDPASGSWATTPVPGVARQLHTATLLPNGLVLVAGGSSTGGLRTSSTQFYDPNNGPNGSWSSGPSLLPARSSHTATLLPNGTVLAFGGLLNNSTATRTGAIFTPSGNSGAWAPLNITDTNTLVPPAFRYGHTATLLATNRVLMAGGRGGNAPGNVTQVIGHSEIFNIATRTFESGRATTASRIDHTATVLPNGRVLLVGGRTVGSPVGNCPEPPSNPPAQIFDPFVPLGAAAVVQIANPVQMRNAHTATLLPGGQVLLAGGLGAEVLPNCTDDLLRHSELYDPGLNYQESWRPAISFLTGNANLITANGTTFQGISEAAGHGAQSAASNYPVAQLLSLGNEQLVFIPINSANGWSNNAFNYAPLAGFAPGLARLTIYANGIPSVARVVNSNGSDFTPSNAARTGTISGRVVYHNGEGILANVALAPEQGSPAGCTPARTITTAPNGEFIFRELVITPTPTPTPQTSGPTIDCSSIQQTITGCNNNGCVCNYTPPTVTPAGTAVTCTPPSGSFFPLGLTPINCTATNTAGSASCSTPHITSRQVCPANIVRSTSGGSVVVTYPPPQVFPSTFTSVCTPPSGSAFPVGITTVRCQVVQHPINICSFTVTVQQVVGLADNKNDFAAAGPGETVIKSGSSPTQSSPINTPLRGQDTFTAPEQRQNACRYRITPAATSGNQTLNFFPASALFNMVDDTLSFNSSPESPARLAAEPNQSGEQNCTNCVNNVFVSNGPTWVLSGRVQRQDGMGVADVNLEFSVPYAIQDDRLICFLNGAPVTCNTPGAKTVTGDPCARASTNLLDPAAAFHCVCTQENNGVCEKTVLARYPTPPQFAALERNAASRWSPLDWRLPVFQINPDGTFTVADVPHGANAVVTPQNRAGGTQYSFTHQPLAPPGLPPQSFIRIDRVERPYGDQNITAQTACTAPNATITPTATQVCASSTGHGASVPDAGAGATYNWTITNGTLIGGQGTRTIVWNAGGAGTTTLNVTVATGASCSASGSAPITVTPIPSANAGPDQTLCQGANGTTTFTLNGTVANGSPQWLAFSSSGLANITFANAGSAVTTVTVTGTGSAILRLAATNVTCGPVPDEVVITVNPLPAATITPTAAQVCAASTGNTASVPDAGAGATYNWTISGGTLTGGQGTRNITYTAGAAGSVTLNVTVTTGATCSASNSVVIPITPQPSANAGADQSLCQAATGTTAFSLNGVVANGSPAWSVINATGGASATIVSPNNASTGVNVSGTGTVTLRLTVTGGAGCALASDDVVLTVNALPATPVITAPASVCANSSNNQASGPAGASGYEWTISNGTITGGASTQTVTYTAGATGNVTLSLRVTNAATCSASNALNIPINTVPTVTAQPANQTVCDNSAVSFTSAAINASAVQWQVSTDGGANFANVPGATDSTLSFSASAGQNGALYRALFTNTCGAVNTNAVTLTVNPLLSISTQPASQAACVGASVTFSAVATGTAPLSYQWRKNGAPINNATGSSFTINAAASGDAGSYDVVINSGCGMAMSSAATLTINAFALSAANAGFPATGGTGSVDLTATVSQCAWNATSNDSWITISPPSSGTGSGRINYSVAANTATTARTGTLVIAGLTFTVTQSGSAPAPRLDTLSQNSALAGSAGFMLTVTGANFTNASVVRWQGSARTTNFGSATQMTAQLTTADLATAGTFVIDVFDPPPGGGASNQLTFTVIQPNPSPTIASLNPNATTAGGGQFNLTVNGTNFINNSVVRWNGNARSTSFGSATQLTATIPASDIANPGTAQVTVFNPAPGGGESSAASFTISQQPVQPMLGDITPDAAVTGGEGFMLTVTGGGFTGGSVVRWAGSDRPTTVVSSTRLTAAIPASDIATPGVFPVTVFTPPPGGGTSVAITFVVGSLGVNVSAASFVRDRGAAEAIMSLFGVELATETRNAEAQPLPTTLAGTTVRVRDSLNVERPAPLFFVSPGQINYLVPLGTALGAATVIVTAGNNRLSVSTLDVQMVAPGLFTSNSDGQGVPAGLLLRALSNGQQMNEPLAELQNGRFVPRPLNLGPEGDRVFLILFGTGLHGLTSVSNATATLGGVNLPITFLGAQGDFAGLDQVNLGPLPRSLAGRGNVTLVLTVEGRAANTVQLNIQ